MAVKVKLQQVSETVQEYWNKIFKKSENKIWRDEWHKLNKSSARNIRKAEEEVDKYRNQVQGLEAEVRSRDSIIKSNKIGMSAANDRIRELKEKVESLESSK